MLQKITLQIVAGIGGIWLATEFVDGVSLGGNIQTLLIIGVILGLINTFVKPPIKLITLPIRILTLGLFSIVINMAVVWVVDILFIELIIVGILPLFWTTLILWGLSTLPKLFNR